MIMIYRKPLFLIFVSINVFFFSCKNADSKDGNGTTDKIDRVESNMDILNADKSADEFAELFSGSFIMDFHDEYQSIFSSQNYETFYQIYCKLNFKKIRGADYIKSMEFKIVNYKGPLNLGFAKTTIETDQVDYKEGFVGIKLVVRGMSNKDTIVYNIPDTLKIKKKDVTRLNVYRILMPLNTDMQSSSLQGIFDSEFYYRSGMHDPLKRKRFPGQHGYPKDTIGSFDMKDLLDRDSRLRIFGDGLNCYSSTINVK